MYSVHLFSKEKPFNFCFVFNQMYKAYLLLCNWDLAKDIKWLLYKHCKQDLFVKTTLKLSCKFRYQEMIWKKKNNGVIKKKQLKTENIYTVEHSIVLVQFLYLPNFLRIVFFYTWCYDWKYSKCPTGTMALQINFEMPWKVIRD